MSWLQKYQDNGFLFYPEDNSTFKVIVLLMDISLLPDYKEM